MRKTFRMISVLTNPEIFAHPLRGRFRIPRDLLQTLQDFRAAGPALRSGCPTPIEHSPQVLCEPRALHSSRSLRALTTHDLPHDGKLIERREGGLTTEHLIDDHPQGVTIRLLRRSIVLGTGLVPSEELRTHPWNRAAWGVRTQCGRVCGIRYGSKESEIREARTSILADEDVGLEK